MQTGETKYRLAELKDRKGDLSKRWYVEYYATDYITKTLIPCREYISSSKYPTAAERIKISKEIITTINSMLLNGGVVNYPEQETKELKNNSTLISKVFEITESLKSNLKNKRSRTKMQGNYNCFLDFLVSSNLTNISVDDFNYSHAEKFKKYLLDKSLNPSTINGYIAHLKRVFSSLVKLKVVQENIFEDVEYLIERPLLTNVGFTKKQQSQIEKYLFEHHIWLFYFTRFLYNAFLRVDETRNLKIADINFEKKIIRITVESDKKSKIRWIPVPSSLWKHIEDMKLQDFSPDFYVFGHTFKPDKEQLSFNYASMVHRTVLRKIGIVIKGVTPNRYYTLYSWRGTGADRAIERYPDMDIIEVQQHLRHERLDTTQKYLKLRGLKVNEKMKGRSW